MGGLTQADVQRLAEPTPADSIKQRQGPGGRMLDYVDARFVMDRLDELGPGNWQDRYEDVVGAIRCGIGIKVDGEWIWKWDVGVPSDIEPEKGAHSEAFKRAGVKWGIGRDLYGDHARPEAPRPPTTARSAPPPVQTAARAVDDVPEEPDWLAGDVPPHLQAVNGPAPVPPTNVQTDRPLDPREGHYGDTCPKHKGRPWKDTKYGPKCTAQDADGKNGYCIWKPSQRWIAEHETVPA